MKAKLPSPRPTIAVLEAELQRLQRKRFRRKILRKTVFTTVSLIFLLALTSILWFPVLQIHGSSMSPTLQNGDVIICVKTVELSHREIAIFHYNSKLLVKRIIGCSGDTLDVRDDGVVIRNGTALSEPYVAAPAAGIRDMPLPCKIPENSYFLMGDYRLNSLDSRSSKIGCVPKERMLGKVLLRIWPLHRFGKLQ